MIPDFITWVFIIILVLLAIWLVTRRPSGLPPGPPRLPVFGNFLSMNHDLRVTTRKLRRRYGDIYSFYIFNNLTIFLNGYNVLRDALVKNADVFSDRPHSFLNDQLAKQKGVVASSGQTWKEQRKFALTTLRDLGMGKSVLEDKIQEEVTVFLQALGDERGQAFDISPVLHNAVSNIICSVVFGKRFEYNDPLFGKFLHCVQENFSDLRRANMFDMLPLMKYLPGDIGKLKKVQDNLDFLLNEFFKPSIKEHLQHHDDGKTDDFISAYIHEMRQQEGETTTMDEENLNIAIADLFAAGTETTATTIRWALVYFLNYPDVQERCFQEIKENIGLNRSPCMKDKTSLPYLEATIMEVLRCGQIAPVTLPHSVPHDVQFHGYTFPKGVTVIPVLSSVLDDPDIWGDPENFRPQRFLEDSGKVSKMEGFIPFSLGRRVCLGESMARMELFLFLASMIQRFEFVSASGVKPSVEGVFGFTHSPKPFKLRLVSRN